MPRYEFQCKECRYGFDIQASVAEKEKGLDLVCEKCGGTELEQVFGGISILTGSSVKPPSSRGGGCCNGPGCC